MEKLIQNLGDVNFHLWLAGILNTAGIMFQLGRLIYTRNVKSISLIFFSFTLYIQIALFIFALGTGNKSLIWTQGISSVISFSIIVYTIFVRYHLIRKLKNIFKPKLKYITKVIIKRPPPPYCWGAKDVYRRLEKLGLSYSIDFSKEFEYPILVITLKNRKTRNYEGIPTIEKYLTSLEK